MVIESLSIPKREVVSPTETHQWFSLIALPHPTTSEELSQGMQLELAHNVPRNVSLEDKQLYWKHVRQLRRTKKGRPGFHDPLKMAVTPAEQDPARPNVFRYDAKPTGYAATLALVGNPEVPQRLQEEVNHGGVEMMWITSDNKIVFEERSPYTQLYPGAAGPIGGSLEGTLTRNADGRPILADASPSHIISHGLQETHEELGVSPELLERLKGTPGEIRIAGVMQDNFKKQFDIVCVGRSPQSSEEIKAQYIAHKEGNDHLHDPMPKKLLFIDATPEAIVTLLGSSDVTLAPATQASFAITGHLLMLERVFAQTGSVEEAVRQATVWKEQTEKRAAENNKRKERQVLIFNRAQRQARLWSRFEEVKTMQDETKRNEALEYLQQEVHDALEKDAPGFDPMKKLSDQGLQILKMGYENQAFPTMYKTGITIK